MSTDGGSIQSDASGATAARRANSQGLCASCDRCRARKTKCDGNRPCSNCIAKYVKRHKLPSAEGVDVDLFECVYSPAKRRGPVPGKAGAARKASEALAVQHEARAQLSQTAMMQGMMNAAGMSHGGGGAGGIGMGGGGTAAIANEMDDMAELQRQLLLQQQLEQQMAQVGGTSHQHQQQLTSDAGLLGGLGGGMGIGMGMDMDGGGTGATNMSGMLGSPSPQPVGGGVDLMQQQQQQLFELQRQQQQLQQQQQMHAMQQQMQQNSSSASAGPAAGIVPSSSDVDGAGAGAGAGMEPSARRARTMDTSTASATTGVAATANGDSALPRSVTKHLPLLSKSNIDGNRLRSYYDLSIDDLFRLPPIPTDEEYCARLSVPIKPKLLPRFDLAALQAARFSEIALGALANNQVALALELSNATVMCLRECVEEPIHPSCMYDVARAYFLHGLFRSYRGDMPRYFKYRRVCLTHLSQLDNVPGVESLLAAISFHDSWAYMIHNAAEDALPDIDEAIPPLPAPPQGQDRGGDADVKYGVSSNPSLIVSNPINQMWIQGPPPVFINNEAPALSRSLDALACAVRSCCDQANARFEGMAKELEAQNGGGIGGSGGGGGEEACDSGGCGKLSATGTAVMANEEELCSRNMVLSAFTLLQQHETAAAVPGGGGQGTVSKNHGHHLVVSAMDAFLEGGDEEEAGGFTDSQIQSLLSVCNTVIEHPLLLYQAGPTYHMISNAAVLLCHLLNGMHAQRGAGGEAPGEMEAALFDEVLDTYLAVRKLLSIHRRKLPVRLRCHGIPRPNLAVGTSEPGAPFIDLGETLMCGSRGCQAFVLMACSPCVAAERARSAAQKQQAAAQQEAAANGIDVGFEDISEFDRELFDIGQEFDLDDDDLLNVLSRIIAT
eukprot:CAMPEP_0178598568 /NCGR_PEP_ID=MMETSP0697-20121206/32819_1 /TAXON_ID=265572 /ORGANISM="Extubocellulus spinifer, Strain CCMP396" /LENGTH=894 /DNA_ID=CAMNT_0020236359 /DNA_START=322 /DNA_END=3006 /DNA_ORIENTATION=+